jgi:type II secretory pathway component PulJ
MKSGLRATKRSGFCASRGGFTLAEVLAALMFMAIVIPVALEAMHIASGAGENAARRNEAALVAERLLNESIVTGDWSGGIQKGSLRQGMHEFEWALQDESWNEDISQYSIHQVSIEVRYWTQGRERSVRLSTLVNETNSVSL